MCFIGFNKLWKNKIVSRPLALHASFLFSDGPSKQATSFHESETFPGVDYRYSYTFFTLKNISYWREKVDEYCRNGKQPINGEENVLNSQLVYNFCVIEVEVTEIMTDT